MNDDENNFALFLKKLEKYCYYHAKKVCQLKKGVSQLFIVLLTD